jgi:hypothetical protein
VKRAGQPPKRGLWPARAAVSAMLAQRFVNFANNTARLLVNDPLVVLVVASVDYTGNDMPPARPTEPLKLVMHCQKERSPTIGRPPLQCARLMDRNSVGSLHVGNALRTATFRAWRTIDLAQSGFEIRKRIATIRAHHSGHTVTHVAILSRLRPRRCRAAVPAIHTRMTGRTSTEEVADMPEPRNGGVKTLAIRLEGELHAQLSLVAQLDGLTLTDAIRQAIDEFIERKRAEGDFASRAAAMLEEIDREAATRRQSIEALFGKTDPSETAGESPKGRSRRGEQTT